MGEKRAICRLPLEPEHLFGTVRTDAETRVADGGVLCDGRMARLVLGTWDKAKVDDPWRNDADFQSIAITCTNPETVEELEGLLRDLADCLHVASGRMRVTLSDALREEVAYRDRRSNEERLYSELVRARQKLLNEWEREGPEDGTKG